MRRSRRLSPVAGLVVVSALAAAACGGSRQAEGEEGGRPVTRSPGAAPVTVAAEPVRASRPLPSRPGVACRAGKLSEVGSRGASFAAVARRPTVARRSPGGPVVASFGRFNVNGHAIVFGIRGVGRDSCGRLWYQVALPVRPNGSRGYVKAADVRVLRLTTRIVVDLSERRLTLLDGERPVIRTAAAVGAAATPTPTGRYYVNQRLIPADPTGPWGPGAIGVSAHSEVLQGWSQGGPIAIHGTDEPGSIGRAASHGCIRVSNDMLRRLFAATPAGTPVVIRE